jgi:hypothetical protein
VHVSISQQGLEAVARRQAGSIDPSNEPDNAVDNAVRIVERAIDQVEAQEGFLGQMQPQTIAPAALAKADLGQVSASPNTPDRPATHDDV